MHLLGILPIVAGVGLAVPGYLGLTSRLPRNRFAGVRTSATLRDEGTFRVANRVAGLPMIVAGLVGVLGGVVALLAATTAAALVAAVLGCLGLLCIAVGGGVLGHRAALAVPEPRPEAPAGCAGCACGGCGKSVGANVSGMGGQ